MSAPGVAVLATADWAAPLWTNKQHLALALSATAEVTYVESIGMRRPRLTAADLRRTGQRIRRSSSTEAAEAAAGASIRVVSPLAVPKARTRAATGWNAFVLRRQLGEWVRSRGPRILWTFAPATFGLETLAHRTVYHCVDLMEHSPGADPGLVRAQEERLAAVADHAIASSPVIRDHLRSVGFHDVRLWENVGQVELFAEAAAAAEDRVPARVVFAGHLTPEKVDLPLVRALAADPRVDLHLAGPASLDGSTNIVRQLVSLGAVSHGVLSPARLAELVGHSGVGIIPYALSPSTRGVLPLKLYEYLAGGLHVVATAIPAIVDKESLHPGLVVASSDDFHEKVIAAIDAARAGPPDAAERGRRLRAHSWTQRALDVQAALSELTEGW